MPGFEITVRPFLSMISIFISDFCFQIYHIPLQDWEGNVYLVGFHFILCTVDYVALFEVPSQ